MYVIYFVRVTKFQFYVYFEKVPMSGGRQPLPNLPLIGLSWLTCALGVH